MSIDEASLSPRPKPRQDSARQPPFTSEQANRGTANGQRRSDQYRGTRVLERREDDAGLREREGQQIVVRRVAGAPAQSTPWEVRILPGAKRGRLVEPGLREDGGPRGSEHVVAQREAVDLFVFKVASGLLGRRPGSTSEWCPRECRGAGSARCSPQGARPATARVRPPHGADAPCGRARRGHPSPRRSRGAPACRTRGRRSRCSCRQPVRHRSGTRTTRGCRFQTMGGRLARKR